MLIGHKKQWQYLKKLAELKKIPHAFLFSGPEKIGKKTFVFEFAKFFLKEDVAKKSHPDFIFLQPEKKEIHIGQIRDFIWQMSLKPFVSDFKIAVIDQAHSLNQEAQNSLLKTLEEPKGKSVLFLVTEYPERLLPTIVSRCQILKFYPLKKEEIIDYLRKQRIKEEKIEQIVKNSFGKPGLVVDFLLNDEKLNFLKDKIEDLNKILNGDLFLRFQFAEKLSKDYQEATETLNVWLRYFRDILISKTNQKFFKKYSFNQLKNIIQKIEETNFLMKNTNVNARLVLEILMLNF